MVTELEILQAILEALLVGIAVISLFSGIAVGLLASKEK